jgi:streptogramin lyase
MRILFCIACMALAAPVSRPVKARAKNAFKDIRTRVEASPVLPFKGVHFAANPTDGDWQSGIVSWVAIGRKGEIYEIQRGSKAAPIIVLNPNGKILRSWGKGEYSIPHAIRIDPSGNVWTVDAGSSTVIEYSAVGKKLMTIAVGEQPDNGNPFHGATDIAFGPRGHLFIADGYGNARILEYTKAGKRVKQWGEFGAGPGQFNLPHAIQIDANGTIYVADRQNGRIEKFDIHGKYLGEIANLGRVFSIKVGANALWATIQPFDQAVTSGGWIVKLDPETGKILGHLNVPEYGGHCIELSPSREPVVTMGNGLLWFKPN